MKHSENEKLRDMLIGEAVMALLNGKAPVSWRAVLDALQNELNAGHGADRTRAAMMAIQEVKAEMLLSLAKQESGGGNLTTAVSGNDDILH